MKISDDLKNKLKKNGSPVVGIILFVAAFLVTTLIIGSCTRIEIDQYELGQTVRAIVDGENGEVVAQINDVEYYEKDLNLVMQMLKLTEPQYTRLKEEQFRQIAGNSLVQQKLLLLEFDRLSLEITNDEFQAYLQTQKDEAFSILAEDSADAKALTDYMSGYGCTYAEYWEDTYVLQSYWENLKFDKVRKVICEKEGYSSVSAIVIDRYLTQLIEDEVYVITLFGEKFK